MPNSYIQDDPLDLSCDTARDLRERRAPPTVIQPFVLDDLARMGSVTVLGYYVTAGAMTVRLSGLSSAGVPVIAYAQVQVGDVRALLLMSHAQKRACSVTLKGVPGRAGRAREWAVTHVTVHPAPN